MKTCSWCGESKDESEYSLKGNGKLKAHCKECHVRDNTKRYHANPNKFNTLEPTVDEKRCCRCGLTKTKGNFYQDPKRKDGLHPECKQCRKESHYKREYGLEYSTARTLIENGCRACGAKENEARLVIDHCHKTGLVRGCLCSSCNTALGLLGDNITTVLKLANHLADSMEQ